MHMGYGLVQEQTQKLVMTMQMKQAIEVLQCSATELYEYVAQQIADNPFAEVIPASTDYAGFGRHGRASLGTAARNGSGGGLPLEQTVRSELSLIAFLERQLGHQSVERQVFDAARYMIGCLNESGYLNESMETLADALRVSHAVINQALELVQSLDPPGIGARSLRECLRLQISSVTEHLRHVVSLLIEDHLQDIANGRIPAIAKKLKLQVKTVQEGVDAIRKLNPRPGLCYRIEPPEYVIPDVIVERKGPHFVVISNEYSEPRVRLSSVNQQLLNGQKGEEAREFAQRNLHSAEWIVKCLQQRRVTLHRVAQELVDFQTEFLDKGRAHMKPLTLRQVAESLGLHESTISRATRGKYMQTPRGVYEMRFFFTAELQSADGVTSSEAAKHQIQRLIETEDAQNPHSDETIAKELTLSGIHISRRTVAKYREEMGIPTSARRRRFA